MVRQFSWPYYCVLSKRNSLAFFEEYCVLCLVFFPHPLLVNSAHMHQSVSDMHSKIVGRDKLDETNWKRQSLLSAKLMYTMMHIVLDACLC